MSTFRKPPFFFCIFLHSSALSCIRCCALCYTFHYSFVCSDVDIIIFPYFNFHDGNSSFCPCWNLFSLLWSSFLTWWTEVRKFSYLFQYLLINPEPDRNFFPLYIYIYISNFLALNQSKTEFLNNWSSAEFKCRDIPKFLFKQNQFKQIIIIQ